MLFLATFYPPPPCHTLSHIPGPPHESTSHISDPPPPIFSKPSTKIPDKSPLVQILSQLFAEVFVWLGFCPFPLLSQCIYYNRKLNITLNFVFHMYDKNLYKRDVTCS